MPTHDGSWPQGTPCWVDCQVDDPAKAREFYADLFGWDVQDSPPDAGGYLMAVLDGAPAAGIGSKPMPMPSVWTTYLAADSADDIHAKILAAGGTALMAPFDVMDVGRMFVATDPTGAAFGVWEAKSMPGAGVYNEPGAYTWNEVQTRDFDAAKAFYEQVFGYTFAEIGDGVEMRYATFALPGGTDPVGGMNDLTTMPGETPAHWLAWFNVADTDATVGKAKGLGADVLADVSDSPFGRMAILAAPQGEAFGVIDPSRTVGEAPPPRE
jgi:hypothetical protein